MSHQGCPHFSWELCLSWEPCPQPLLELGCSCSTALPLPGHLPTPCPRSTGRLLSLTLDPSRHHGPAWQSGTLACAWLLLSDLLCLVWVLGDYELCLAPLPKQSSQPSQVGCRSCWWWGSLCCTALRCQGGCSARSRELGAECDRAEQWVIPIIL